ncbi:type VI secretion system Vgr family protein [Aquisalimonas asiatica]|uniref:Type VI secretion system secreted protein VgrG n=1 Tax=Aquisalimonas asiatica TaxID=406100 RepID=A0A1H8SB42_9GAMM|nr:type VI secretion system tip protein TssI/VgrG [Aquisalimonas asiatica]SEO75594.1 type VI secretion system secreted protein VgrG [Aquisalimonas asiatica]
MTGSDVLSDAGISWLAGALGHEQFRLRLQGVAAEHIDVETFESSDYTVGGDYAFRIGVGIRSSDELDPDALPGTQASLALQVGEGSVAVHGVVACIEMCGRQNNRREAVVHLRSPLTLLDGVRNHRVFRRRTAPAIAREVLQDALDDVAAVVVEGGDEAPEQPMVVQNNETDLAFVRRVLARDGLFLALRQRDTEAEVVIHDDLAAVTDTSVALRYARQSGQVRGSRDTVDKMRVWGGLEPSRATMSDFDPAYPDHSGPGEASTSSDVAGAGTLRMFGQRGGGQDASQALADVHMAALDTRRQGAEIETENRALAPGVTVEISEHPDDAVNGDYVVISTYQKGDQAAVLHGGTGVGRPTYRCVARLLPANVPYREAPADKPSVSGGLLVGEVEGDDKDKAHLDDEGAYRIRFAMDDGDADTGQASPPVRMSQPYGGKDYGMHFPLLPKTKVAMAALNGDAERPVILGALSTPRQPAPVNTNNRYQHLLRTPGGHALCLNDKPGGQRVTLAAGNARGSKGIDADGNPKGAGWLDIQAGDQEAHRVELVTEEGAMQLHAGEDMEVRAGGNRQVTVEGSQDTWVKGDVTLRSEEGAITHAAAEALEMTTDSGDLLLETTDGDVQIQAGDSLHLQARGPMSATSEEGSLSLVAGDGMLHVHGEAGLTIQGGVDQDIHVGRDAGLVIRGDGSVVLRGDMVEIVADEIVQSADTISEN